MSLEEEFSDVADFVQEDDTFDADEGTSEDEVERKIAEEHAKYKEAQAKRQEEVRANRSWSAPPMESPRPEQQKERERERQARASQHDAPPDPAPRAEYEPPPRPYLPAQASGGASNLSYLSRPQSAEQRAPSRLSSSGNRGGGLGSSHTPASLSGIEEEAGEPSSAGTGVGGASRQASDAGRWPAGTGTSSPAGRGGGAEDEGAEAEASAAPAVEEEESREPMPEPSGEREGDEGEEGAGGRSGAAEAEPSAPEEPEAEEVAEDDAGHSLGGGEGSHAALAASFSLRPQAGRPALEEESSAPPPEEEDSSGRRPSDGHHDHEAASSIGAASHRTAPPPPPEPAMAMRGFVEPLEYERSEVQEEGEEEAAAVKDEEEEEEEEEEKQEEEEEDAYEDDAFEDEGADEEEEEEEEEEDKPAAASAEASYSSAPLVAAPAAASVAAGVPPIPKFGAAAQDDEDDEQLFRRAAAAAAAANGRGLAASAAAAAPPPPAPAAQPELLPPQQFAMQLLKHDLEVLPQHHKAAADAAAARRRPTSARPAGAGLAAFGYLGYHIPDEGLTAPSGVRTSGGGSGRPGSPGREGSAGAAGLAAGPSLTTIRVPGAEGAGEEEEGAAAGRPTSAPHMRPDAAEPAAMPTSHFIGATRDMRAAGRGLPPLSGQAPGGGRPGKAGGAGRGGGGAAAAGGTLTAAEGGSPPTEASLSVLDEQEAHAAQNRIKFDVWLDALSGNHAAPAATNKAGGDGASAGGSRRSRPMTAPATGRRRPVSARPGAAAAGPVGGAAAGVYGVQPYTVNVPKPLGRPMSAQPRPTSAGRGGAPPPLPAGPVDVPDRAQAASAADMPVTVSTLPPGALGVAVGGGTAAVEVAGVPVSVYVADTLKRIIEANRWLAALGVAGKRYRLKDRYSNMTVQLIEEMAPMQYDAHAQHTYGGDDAPGHGGAHGGHGHGHGHGHGQYGHSPYGTDGAGGAAGAGAGGGGGGNVTVLKELTLKQFLSGHSRLKQQVKRLRQAAPQPAPSLPPQGLGLTDGISAGPSGSRTHRPFSAGPGGPGAGAGGGSRSRPVSAMPYSGGAAGAGGGPAAYSGGGSGGGAAPPPRPVRPSSANPAYGRTPQFGGTSPPGAPGGGGFTGLASSRDKPRNNNSGGGAAPPPPAHHRTAWGAGGANNTSGGGGAPLPYMVRSVSAKHQGSASAPYAGAGVGDDEEDDEGALVVEADERGDVSRAVRQQLGGAAEFCQARRAEIARLRNMPYA